MLLSLLVLGATWAMEDPQPWLPERQEAAPADAPAPGAAALPPGPGAAAPKRPLPCVGASLLGTLVGDSGAVSFAAVDLGDRVVTATFGDGLPCGVITGIEPDRLILQGKEGQRLVLERASSADPAPPRVAGSAVPAVKHHSGGVYELRRSDVERLIVEPPAEIVSSTRMLPVFERGSVAGYKLQFPDSSLLASLGVRSGDVLRTVNGIALNRPGAMLDAYQRIRDQGTGELEVTRGGSALKLRYVLR